ncbi:protein kinase [Anaerolineales bacterium HSG6]|nr:protein kinase [Anaerolineales bacterium HSG6]
MSTKIEDTQQKLGPYSIIENLTRLDGVKLYLAENRPASAKQDEKLVTLKVVSPRLPPADWSRVIDEFKHLPSLQHPHIIEVYKTELLDNNQFVIVRAYYGEGTRLSERLTQKKPFSSLDRVIKIITQMGRALSYAHQQGVVHGDLNPYDIWLLGESAYLTNFGLAPLVLGSDRYKPRNSRKTPVAHATYMAPEQWQQKAPTPASDVYTLALIFTKMLIGKLPFGTDDFDRLLLNPNPEKPAPSLPNDGQKPFFHHLLYKAMASDPTERYHSITEFLTAIKTVQPYLKRYDIVRSHGKGGYGQVYKVWDKERKIDVALKMLHPLNKEDSQGGSAYERFVQEADILKKLSHSNIISILARGVDSEDKLLFFTMDYIEENLAQRLEKDKIFSREQAVRITIQLGEALAKAHLEGYIHRDLKPANILLRPANSNMVDAVLADFGVAKSINRRDSITKKEDVIGSLRYMSPEQFGKGKVTPASDQYALAILLFEMLQGYPFSKAGIDETRLEQAILNELLPALQEITYAAFNPVLQKANAKTQTERYPNIYAFLEALKKADQKVITAEEEKLKKKAGRSIVKARDYVEDGDYEDALKLLDNALQHDPGQLEATGLKGKIHWERGEITRFHAVFKDAYQRDRKTDSIGGLAYLGALQKISEYYLAKKEWSVVQTYYREFHTVLRHSSSPTWRTIYQRLAKEHHIEGLEAYDDAEWQYEQHDQTSFSRYKSQLNRQIDLLTALGATEQQKALQQKQKLLGLQEQHLKGVVAYEGYRNDKVSLDEASKTTKTQIVQIKNLNQLSNAERKDKIDDLETKLADLKLEKRYQKGIAVYAGGNPSDLAGAVAELRQIITELRQKGKTGKAELLEDKLAELEIKKEKQLAKALLEQAKAKEEEKPVESLKYYESIQDIITKYAYIGTELAVTPSEVGGKIENLRDRLRDIHNYGEIKQLIGENKNIEALETLCTEFLGRENYEYEDVTQLFYDLAYPIVYDGQSSPDKKTIQITYESMGKMFGRWTGSAEQLKAQYQRLQTEIIELQAEFDDKETVRSWQDKIKIQLSYLQQAKGDIESWQDTLNRIGIPKVDKKAGELSELFRSARKDIFKIETEKNRLVGERISTLNDKLIKNRKNQITVNMAIFISLVSFVIGISFGIWVYLRFIT